MSLAAAIQTARHTAQTITWTDGDGDPQDLTGAILTGRILSSTGSSRSIDGDLEIVDASEGVFTWTYGENDVAVADLFKVQFVATYGDSTNDKTMLEQWTVYREIVVS